MKRLRLSAAASAALIALSGLLGACNLHVLPYAAVVGGSTISQSTLNETMSAIAGNHLYTCQLTSGSPGVRIEGAGKDTYASSFAADVLSILIEQQAVREEVEHLGVAEPSGLDAIAQTQVIGGLGAAQSQSCPAPPDEVFKAFPKSYRDRLVAYQTDEDALAAHLAGTSLDPASLAAYVRAHPGTSEQACVSVIIVKTAAEAAALHTALEHGGSFSKLAKEHSIDTQTAPKGGAVGCGMSFEFAPPLGTVVANAPVGKATHPIAFNGDYVLLEVTSRSQVPVGEVVTALFAAHEAAVSSRVAALLSASPVQVSSQYGHWSSLRTLRRVIAPVPPPVALVPNPKANLGSYAATTSTGSAAGSTTGSAGG